MELVLDHPQAAGGKIRLDSDRQFDRQQGDSVMRFQTLVDGTQVFDATYAELSAEEADLMGELLRQVRQPSQLTQDRIAQEVHAIFQGTIGGRDAAQIAAIVGQSWWKAIRDQLGVGDEPEAERIVNGLAQRFDRTASKRREPAAASNGSGTQQQRPSGQSSR